MDNFLSVWKTDNLEKTKKNRQKLKQNPCPSQLKSLSILFSYVDCQNWPIALKLYEQTLYTN